MNMVFLPLGRIKQQAKPSQLFRARTMLKLLSAVAIGMSCAMMIATIVGTFISMLFHRINIDPAVATGPFVTSALDIVGLTVYFAAARILILS